MMILGPFLGFMSYYIYWIHSKDISLTHTATKVLRNVGGSLTIFILSVSFKMTLHFAFYPNLFTSCCKNIVKFNIDDTRLS